MSRLYRRFFRWLTRRYITDTAKQDGTITIHVRPHDPLFWLWLWLPVR